MRLKDLLNDYHFDEASYCTGRILKLSPFTEQEILKYWDNFNKTGNYPIIRLVYE